MSSHLGLSIFQRDIRLPALQAEIRWDSGYIETALERSWNFTLAAVAPQIVETAKESIKTDPKPSRPGEPPHTRGRPGHNIRDAIGWHVDAEDPFHDAVISISEAMVGHIGFVMEYGGEFRGHHYPPRPILWPAVDAHLFRFVEHEMVSGRLR